MPWLLEHTCLILNTTVKGADGTKAWRKIRGRDFHGQIAGFCKEFLYKLPGKGCLSKPEGNMGTKWKQATYLGHSLSSNVLGTPKGLEDAQTIYRRPESERWSVDASGQACGTPKNVGC